MASFLELIPPVLVQLTLSVMALFIILLVLVQRGRGGGLAGALGGPGGSSAFGAKAGDTFTKITIWVVSIWIVTCLLASGWAANRGDAFGDSDAALTTGSMESTDDEDEAAADDAADETADTEAAAPADAPAEDKAAE